MRSLNRVELIGHLGADPETRYTAAGDAVTNLRLATNEAWTDRASGEPRERTEWHRCVLWRRLAEIARDYLVKGARVYVAGPLSTRQWQDQQGQNRYTTEVQVRDLIMLDAAGTSAHPGQQPAQQPVQHRAQTPPPGHAASAPPAPPPVAFQAPTPDHPGAPAGNAYTDFDDDIPF